MPGLFLWCALLLASAWSVDNAAAEPLVLSVRQAEAALDQRTREPIVTIRFTPSSTHLFAEFTARNVGRTVEFRIDGRTVMKTVIREPIVGGSGQIAGGFTVEQTRDIAARLLSGDAKLEVEVVEN